MLSINFITSVYMYKYNVRYCLGGCRHCHSKVDRLFYNAHLQPQYDDDDDEDSEVCSLSYLVFHAVLTVY